MLLKAVKTKLNCQGNESSHRQKKKKKKDLFIFMKKQVAKIECYRYCYRECKYKFARL